MNTGEFILAVAGIVFASTGFWTFLINVIQNKTKKNDALTQIVLGLAHEKIIELCLNYIKRGSITDDEYNDLVKYLYKPHVALGGDGTAEKLMDEVKKLPIRDIEEK